MTPIILVDELVEFIKPIVAEFDLESNVKGVRKAPQVISGFLKEKKPGQNQDPPDFPFVIVRYIEDTDRDDGNIAIVRIIAGTYSEDEQDGWRDALNVVTRIKEELLEKRFIGKAFKVEYPIKTELPEDQPYPEWAAFLTLNISIPHVQEERGLEDVI